MFEKHAENVIAENAKLKTIRLKKKHFKLIKQMKLEFGRKTKIQKDNKIERQ